MGAGLVFQAELFLRCLCLGLFGKCHSFTWKSEELGGQVVTIIGNLGINRLS